MNDHERQCDRIVEQLRGQVVALSVRERAQLKDLPDRRYRVRGVALWWEVKGPRDKFTQGQLDFLRAEYDHGQVVGAGDAASLIRLLRTPPSAWHCNGWLLVGEIAARGLRRERRAA